MAFAPLRFTPARWMQFVDGENLTIRTQELLKNSNRRLVEGTFYKHDRFFWPGPIQSPGVRILNHPFHAEPQPIRSTYYTCVQGGHELVDETRESLRTLGFDPQIFKKHKGTKAKGVDITLTKDMLSHAFRGNYETAVLVAGDGDYTPLVEEVKRLGKRVEVLFFASCTHPELRLSADRFVDITAEIQSWSFSSNHSVEIISEAKGDGG